MTELSRNSRVVDLDAQMQARAWGFPTGGTRTDHIKDINMETTTKEEFIEAKAKTPIHLKPLNPKPQQRRHYRGVKDFELLVATEPWGTNRPF